MEPLASAPRSGIGGIVDKLTGTTRLARKAGPKASKAYSAPRLPRAKNRSPKAKPYENDPNPTIANANNIDYSP